MRISTTIPSLLAGAIVSLFAQNYNGPSIGIGGKVVDEGKKALSGASVALKAAGLKTTTDNSGVFSLVYTNPMQLFRSDSDFKKVFAKVHHGIFTIYLTKPSDISISTYSLKGRLLRTKMLKAETGRSRISIPPMEAGIYFHKIKASSAQLIFKDYFNGHSWQGAFKWERGAFQPAQLLKKGAETFLDTLLVTKAGYADHKQILTNPNMQGIMVEMKKSSDLPKFSFFVTSLKAILELSGNENGFGGDLRFGETGKGAGLRGADKICSTIAEKSMPGAGAKQWRAFLSITEDENGKQVNAIERIGEGPWYDRVGRLLAPTIKDLLNTRPENGHPLIKNDFPNEDGVPNHRPDPDKPQVDNHHFITGSNDQGKLYADDATCKDWTVSDGSRENGQPRMGFSWPRGRGGRTSRSGTHWISGHDAKGCSAGIEIVDNGRGKPGTTWIGSGGGYGGIYCFALTP